MTRRLRIAVLAVAFALVPAAGANAATSPPDVSAPSAIVVEATTGDVAYAKAANAQRPIASATKLMTALLTLERGRLSQKLKAASYRPLAIESKIDLRPGERMTVADLLRALLLESANDAAVTLAEGVGGSRAAFVRRMNRRAAQLGLERTRYEDPIGIGAGNVSTARDLTRLTRRLRRHRFFRRTVARTAAVLQSGAVPRRVVNRNTLVSLPLVDGVKTGHTRSAGWVLVGSGRRASGARRIQAISVVLAAPSEQARNDDTLALLKWGVRRYRMSAPVHEGAVVGSIPIRHRRGAELTVVAARDVRRAVERGRRLAVRVVGLPAEIEGPVRRGQRLGRVEVYDGSRRVARVPAVAVAGVPEAGLAQQTKASLARPFTLTIALAALGASVLLARMGFRMRDRRVRRTREEPKAA